MINFRKNKNFGVTLVEILFVLAIFSILVMIAMPTWLRQRENSRGRSCQENLQKIEGAIEQWAYETRSPDGILAPPLSQLCGPSLYIKKTPTCPSSGVYDTDIVGGTPTCSIGTSSLPYEPHILLPNRLAIK